MNAKTVTDDTATDVCTEYYEGFDQKNTAKEQTMKYFKFPKCSDFFTSDWPTIPEERTGVINNPGLSFTSLLIHYFQSIHDNP